MTPALPLHALLATSPRGGVYVLGSNAGTPFAGRAAAERAAEQLGPLLPGWTLEPKMIRTRHELDAAP